MAVYNVLEGQLAIQRQNNQNQLAQLEQQKYQQEQSKISQLGQILPQAYGGDQNALARLATIDPGTYIKTQESLNEQQGKLAKQIGIAAATGQITPENFEQYKALAVQAGIPNAQNATFADVSKISKAVSGRFSPQDLLALQQLEQMNAPNPYAGSQTLVSGPQPPMIDAGAPPTPATFGNMGQTPPINGGSMPKPEAVIAATGQAFPYQNAGEYYRAQDTATRQSLDAARRKNPMAVEEAFAGARKDTYSAKEKENELSAPGTEGQNKAASFVNRMASANADLETYDQELASLFQRGASSIPVVGNYMTSDAFKRADRAKRDFINAQLRRESGAVISDQEFDNANKQYFPVPGDSLDIITAKRRARMLAQENMKAEAGPAMNRQQSAAEGGQPIGVDPALLEFMTPEEKALFNQ